MPEGIPLRTARLPSTATTKLEAPEGAEAVDVMVSLFGDTALVVATQVGALGTLVQAQLDQASGSFRTSVLMGKRDDPLLGGVAEPVPDPHSHSAGPSPLPASPPRVPDHSPPHLPSQRSPRGRLQRARRRGGGRGDSSWV